MKDNRKNKTLSLIPLRGTIIYPHLASSLYIGREDSLRSLAYAHKHDNKLILVAQKDGGLDSPKLSELYAVGTLCSLVSAKRLPDGTVKALVEGIQRVNVHKLNRAEDGYICLFSDRATVSVSSKTAHTMRNILLKNARDFFKTREKGEEIYNILKSMEDLERLIVEMITVP